jgi:hypothetical protein
VKVFTPVAVPVFIGNPPSETLYHAIVVPANAVTDNVDVPVPHIGLTLAVIVPGAAGI